ncbi:DUF2905 domain-containing protein [candidate division KSB1 bacterium]|nr:DUF2905 domain-containing protein [candidate division KSB1 bacterium]RQW00195.1 MAG: DUF2905 domain-containing protein [candidate division KSB1 bacterium]
MSQLGKIFILIGLLIIFLGFLIILFDRLGLQLGKLPGDIVYHKGNTTFYIPIMTSLVMSLLLTLLFWLFRK